MNTHADKTTDNKSKSVANYVSQKQGGGESTFQFVDNRPEAVAQRKLHEMASNSPQTKKAAQLKEIANNFKQEQKPIQKKDNNTGLPDNLKTGMENLSGISLDDVKVHRNSNKPAQLQAQAYAQGTDIHLGPGQEEHLPHEAWHVVQQKQGRVKPTMQKKGNPSAQLRGAVNVNDDAGLEKEAVVMGARGLHIQEGVLDSRTHRIPSVNSNQNLAPIQMAIGDYLPDVTADAKARKAEFEKALPIAEQNYKSAMVAWKQDKGDVAKQQKMSDCSAEVNKIKQQIRGIVSQHEASAKEVYGQAAAGAALPEGKAKLYLGRQVDTERAMNDKRDKGKEEAGNARVLHANTWSLDINAAFIGGGIDLQARFKFKTNLTPGGKALIQNSQTGDDFMKALPGLQPPDISLYDDTKDGDRKWIVTAREIAQLINKGYKFADAPAADLKKPDSYQAFANETQRDQYIMAKYQERMNR